MERLLSLWLSVDLQCPAARSTAISVGKVSNNIKIGTSLKTNIWLCFCDVCSCRNFVNFFASKWFSKSWPRRPKPDGRVNKNRTAEFHWRDGRNERPNLTMSLQPWHLTCNLRTLHPPHIIGGTVPQVLKQVVNLSCFPGHWQSFLFYLISTSHNPAVVAWR